MNSRDMCMIDHLPDLIRAGVDSIKIEGRAKSAYYAAIVTGAYRHCIDAVQAGKPLDPIWRNEVEKVSHRHYSTGFFYGQPVSSPPTPGISGTGRWWRWSSPAPKRALPRPPCGINFPWGMRSSWSARTPARWPSRPRS